LDVDVHAATGWNSEHLNSATIDRLVGEAYGPSSPAFQEVGSMWRIVRWTVATLLIGALATVTDTAGATGTPKVKARQVAAGGYFSCALLMAGSVQCWGYNQDGENGDGSTRNSRSPQTVGNVEKVTAISAGWDSACALEWASPRIVEALV
jgi:hypothetical protein